jgi:colanic acid/amylovoran biosynthesis glycosyltransferase
MTDAIVPNKSPWIEQQASDLPIFLFTESFPFPPGEQFLENELPFWSEMLTGPMILFPKKAIGTPRTVPANITVSRRLSDTFHSIPARLMATTSVIFSNLFWKEIVRLAKEKCLNRKTVFGLIKAVVRTQLIKKFLTEASAEFGKPQLIYSYWFTEITYGAILSGICDSVVSRAHGWDLYPDRSPYGRALLRPQFIDRMKGIFPVSNDGTFELRKASSNANHIQTSRLGVRIPTVKTRPTGNDQITLLSLSSCVTVKNIDKIIEAISLISQKSPSLKITWHHIGDGPERSRLMKLSSELFSKSNVCWNFVGALPNDEVLRFLSETPIDLLLNTSTSEGIPVSVMEAMSHGIPAVAPNVGGISEIISEDCGLLLGKSPSPQEIADSICNHLNDFKSSKVRDQAAKKIAVEYNMQKNFPDFILKLRKIVANRSS